MELECALHSAGLRGTCFGEGAFAPRGETTARGTERVFFFFGLLSRDGRSVLAQHTTYCSVEVVTEKYDDYERTQQG